MQPAKYYRKKLKNRSKNKKFALKMTDALNGKGALLEENNDETTIRKIISRLYV